MYPMMLAVFFLIALTAPNPTSGQAPLSVGRVVAALLMLLLTVGNLVRLMI